MDQTGFKAVILGASGAVGRELVAELANSPKWSEVAVIVRRKLEQWDNLPNKHKLKITQVESLDCLEKAEIWNFKNYNTMFCVLGSQTKEGEAQFIKVDQTYPTYGGSIAKANGIPHYSLVTTYGADKKSMFLYLRVKGQVEELITNMKFPITTIYRPGGILNRDGDPRFGESMMKYIPFFPTIQSKELGKAIRIDAEKQLEKGVGEQERVIFNENAMILRLLQ